MVSQEGHSGASKRILHCHAYLDDPLGFRGYQATALHPCYAWRSCCVNGHWYVEYFIGFGTRCHPSHAWCLWQDWSSVEDVPDIQETAWEEREGESPALRRGIGSYAAKVEAAKKRGLGSDPDQVSSLLRIALSQPSLPALSSSVNQPMLRWRHAIHAEES